MSDDEEMVVELNMDHPMNRYILDATAGMDDRQFAAFMRRFSRGCAIRHELNKIGSLSKFRMALVVRSLVAVFKAGYHTGHCEGFSRAKKHFEGIDIDA